MPFKYDVSEEELRAVLKDYQEAALRYLWRSPDVGRSSKEVYEAVNESLRGVGTISRTSIIIFLNAMVDEGVLGFHEITGKGGHRRIYRSELDEAGFKAFIAGSLLKSLMRDFPEETKKALEQYR